MICAICKHEDTRTDTTTVTLEREDTTLVIKGVPAKLCTNCGEEYVGEDTSAYLLTTAEGDARAGVQVDVRLYAAA